MKWIAALAVVACAAACRREEDCATATRRARTAVQGELDRRASLEDATFSELQDAKARLEQQRDRWTEALRFAKETDCSDGDRAKMIAMLAEQAPAGATSCDDLRAAVQAAHDEAAAQGTAEQARVEAAFEATDYFRAGKLLKEWTEALATSAPISADPRGSPVMPRVSDAVARYRARCH